MKLINSHKVVDIASAIIAGLFISFSFINYYGNEGKSPAVVDKHTNIGRIGNVYNTGTIGYEQLGLDMGLGSDKVLPLSTVIRAENNFWEIEYLNGKYYRVVREDWEDIQGKYECDEEEEIGNLEALEEYATKQ